MEQNTLQCTSNIKLMSAAGISRRRAQVAFYSESVFNKDYRVSYFYHFKPAVSLTLVYFFSVDLQGIYMWCKNAITASSALFYVRLVKCLYTSHMLLTINIG